MIFQIFDTRENLYEAVEPKKIYEILHEKEVIFNRVLPYMEKLKKATPSKEAMFIYK